MFGMLGLAATLTVAVPAGAGGGGAVGIQRIHGDVQIRPLHYRTGRPTGPWRQAEKGGLLGSFMLRTGRGSWAHVELPFLVPQGGRLRYVPAGCIDPGSLVRIDSAADSTIQVIRGQISVADGKRGGSLPRRLG
jgi:hypothetical protein